MTELRIARVVALAAASGLWLASCGGSDAPAPPPARPIAPQDDGRILAGSDDITAADFVGRTFPLVFERAERASPEAQTETGVGTVTVEDNNTLLVTLPGRDVRRFVRGPGNTFVDGSGVTAEFTDFGPARYLFVETPFGLSAAFGFETPVSARPTSARYTGGLSASVIILTIPGRETVIGIGGEGSVDLTATFTGSGGRIEGILFDNRTSPLGLAQVDLLDVGIEQDELRVRAELDGTITESGFVGTVSGSAEVSMNGGPLEGFGLNIRNSTATGRFFGPAADAIAGSYSADADFTIPGQTQQSGRLTGFFVSE
jgi:hypothetical protein